ncbi:hypothetical protein V1264_017779 [Littorina saxatilis]|uniref:Ig-like domain-containing protein n=2 Tax=Littorina saxatilis TaxID=31220 RepID=A0AAN9GFS2_9CAEN
MPTTATDVSTVSFVSNEADHHNTTIRCSRSDNVSSVTCRINIIEVYRLSSCFVVENAQTPIKCSYREPSHGMYWSVKYPDGTVTMVADCAPCGNDTCPDCDVKNTDFRVTRDGKSSNLRMVNGSDVDKDGAWLQCSRSDNVTDDDCTIKVFYYKLPQCEDGQLDVSEVEPWTTVRCEGLRQLQNMNWTITDHTGNVSQIAFCDSKKNCTTNSSDVTVSRNNTVSQLTFAGHVRGKDNLNLTCVNMNNFTMDSCRIRTFYPAETNNATVRVDSNFTVTGRVYIDKVYASDNITCQWFHTVDNMTGDQLFSNLSLSTFTDTDGLEYQRGHCDMTLPVNSSEITHYFGVLIQPSNKSHQVDGVVTIEKPGPTLTTTCPDYVSEGSDLTCECSHPTAQHGNPPATISWRDVNDTAGLHIRNVSRNMNGSEYTCSSVWGEGRPEEVRSSDYTMLVAYGPNNVTVSAPGDGNDDLQNVTLTCTYDVAYPSVNFTWSVACVAFTLTSESSTCTIDKGMIDVREVACTAFNTEFPELSATRSHTFSSEDVAGPTFPLVGVVVGVVAAVLVVIIIVVVIIVAKRRDRYVDEEKGSQQNKSKDQVHSSEFEEHTNADNVDAVTSLQVLTVRHDQLQGSSKDATRQGQSTEMTHLNKDAKEATIKEKEAKLKMLEMEKQTARENEERNREEKKKKAREQEERKRQQAEEKEARKKQEAQDKEDKKREKAKEKEDKMAEKVREEEEQKREKEREEDAKKKEKEREEEENKKEKAKEEEAKREEKAREEEARRAEKARKEEEDKEKNEAKKKEKEREEEEKREKEKAREEEENRKEEEKRKAKAREDEEKEKKAREEEAKNRQRAAEKDAKQKQEALEKEERKAKTIEDEKRTDNGIPMATQEANAMKEDREGKPHMTTDKPEEKEKKPTETPEEREARKQRKLKKLLEKIMQKIMQVFMDKQGHTTTDTETIKTYEKNREREARKRHKAEEREARRKERLANKKETIEAQEEKEARREARKQQKVQEKEARRKERLARKEDEKTETEEEKEARRQARRVKKEARKVREQDKKAREETRKARKQDRKARDQDEKAREHDQKPKDPALKKDQHQDLTNTAKGVLQAGLGGDVGSEKTARPAETDEFEEHINELYESADDLDRPENSSKTQTTKSKSGAPGLAPDDEFEEHINDFYQSADDLDVPEKSSKMNSPKSTSTPPDDEFEEHINDMYESADDLDNLGNPTKSRQSQQKVEQLADGKYAVDGSIYHELESEEDTSETVTDTDYESIGYDSDIYDSIGELDTTDDSSSDSYADSLDEEIYDYIDDIYESIDDVFDVNSSDITPDTKPRAQDGSDLPLFLKEKLASPGTDALLAELKAVLQRAQKEGVAIPRKEPRPKEKAPPSQAQKEDMKSPCSNGAIQGTPAPSLKGVPNRLDLSGDGCISVKAAKAFLDAQVHMYSQDEWAKKKGKPQEKEWHTEKDPTEKPLKETASGTDKPQDKESRTAEKTDKQAMKVPQSIRQKEDTTKGSVLKKTPPTVPQKPKGGNWKLNGEAQPDAPDEVYTDCLSQSKKVDALTALVGKPTASVANKEVITQEPNAQHKPRRSDLYVSVAPLKPKPKAMTKSAKTGDDNTNGRAAGSKTQEVTKTAEADDMYSELGSTRRRNQEADPIYNHLNQ